MSGARAISRWRLAVLAALLLTALTRPAGAVTFDIPQPDGQSDFVTDQAELLDDAAEARINELAGQLLREQAIPIIVVTIPSMAAVGGEGMRIETFANLLFDQWGIGHERIGQGRQSASWNRGILLLVSEGDRKARIELGADWRHDQDALAQQIMDERILPPFRQGDYGAGILAGVEALDSMARGVALPRVPRPWWHYAAIAGFIGLAVFTVVSLVRRGAGGWAWLFWAAVFSLVGYLLYQMLTRSGRSRGGFSGGSFGGGFSGGGGATGSW